MSELGRRVDALRKPLTAAARDSFAGLSDDKLGPTLRRAWQPLLASLPEADSTWSAWGERLRSFEVLERDEQMLEVARGLRMCVALAPAVRPKAPKRLGAYVLDASPTCLSGIGPAIGERMWQAGIETVADLLWLVPRRYDDCRTTLSPAQLDWDRVGQQVVVAGVVESVRFVKRGRRGWVDLRIADEGESGKGNQALLVVRWFNAHGGMSSRFSNGAPVAVTGQLKHRSGHWEMTNPTALAVDENGVAASELVIRPRYSVVPGVAPAKLRKACLAAVERFGNALPEVLPPTVLGKHNLSELQVALAALHQPPMDLTEAELESLNAGRSEWHRRLSYQELFLLALAIVRRRRSSHGELAMTCAQLSPKAFDDVFGFALTCAQQRAIGAVAHDMAGTVPMNRLLQGDVGCGKTAVAFAAVAQAVKAGCQAAIMAPTEILAAQHAQGLSQWCEVLGIKMAKLTAATPRATRSSMLALLAAGKIDVVVGTHSLLADSVVFAKLALVVVDEQHRFGVAQRARLRNKGDGVCPHLLVMTATPIPRSLALTVYGDLDVTVIDEMPAGRQLSRTQILSGKTARTSAYRALKRRLEKGERAFVVCPLVEPSEDEGEGAKVGRDWADATSVAVELQRALAPHCVALVHGRLAADERDSAMNDFRTGTAQVLVATTVIEVGVDVPEATVMIIEDADRFGMAQLHQLRGRVGRGGGPSECVLLTSHSASDDGAERLEVIARTGDGFVIAEEDLRLRGPGELLGVRQAGLPRLRFGDLRDQVELLQAARADAEAILDADPELKRPEHDALATELADPRWNHDAYGPEGG